MSEWLERLADSVRASVITPGTVLRIGAESVTVADVVRRSHHFGAESWILADTDGVRWVVYLRDGAMTGQRVLDEREAWADVVVS